MVGQLTQVPRRHELRQSVEVVAGHRPISVGRLVSRLDGVQQILLRSDEQAVGLRQRDDLSRKVFDTGVRGSGRRSGFGRQFVGVDVVNVWFQEIIYGCASGHA